VFELSELFAACGIKLIQNKNGVMNAPGTMPHCNLILPVHAVLIYCSCLFVFIPAACSTSN